MSSIYHHERISAIEKQLDSLGKKVDIFLDKVNNSKLVNGEIANEIGLELNALSELYRYQKQFIRGGNCERHKSNTDARAR